MFCHFDVSKCFSVLAPLLIATSVVFVAEDSFADIDRDSCPDLAAEFYVSGRKEPATIALGTSNGTLFLVLGPNRFIADGQTHSAGDQFQYSVTCSNQKVRLTTSTKEEKSTLVIGEWGADGSYYLQRFVDGGDRHPPRQILYDTEKFKNIRPHIQGQCPVFDGSYVLKEKDGEDEVSMRRLSTTKIQGGAQFEMDQIAFTIDGDRHGSANRYYVGICYDGEIEIKMFDGGKVERMFRLSQASIGKDVLFTEYVAARNHATLTYRLSKSQ